MHESPNMERSAYSRNGSKINMKNYPIQGWRNGESPGVESQVDLIKVLRLCCKDNEKSLTDSSIATIL